ncbi:condensation domain-containing protein [Streptomyces sp. LS1784]|uniref:condensation domain-containing protein n=1 Tax=Streptomyces sp. LS1784 TaxID=2851533 RepID=UPI001CCB7AF5|nr:condensation domain-containing protein [Streptomyces sp. LS1784]
MNAENTVTAPMLWGQEYYWFKYFDTPAYGTTPDSIKISRVWRVPRGVPDDDDSVLAALDELVRRHEALRTNYLVDDEGRPVQVIRPPTPTGFAFRATGEAADLPALQERLAAPPFDPARDRPLRAALVRSAGGGTWVVLTVLHAAVDGFSWPVLGTEFEALLASGPAAGPPPPAARQPREQAVLDQGPDRADRRERVRQYWQWALRSMPQSMFPGFRPAPVGHFGGHTPPSPYRRMVLTSRRLATAAERVAAQRRVTPSTVYLAAFGIALSAMSGNERCAISMDTSNRSEPLLKSAVGCFFQPALVILDADPDQSAQDFLSTVFRSAMRAQRHSRYSHLDVLAEQTRIGFERGMNLRIGVTYNYFSERGAKDTARTDPADRDGNRDDDGADGAPDIEIRPASIDWQDNSADLYLAVQADDDGVALAMHGHVSVTDTDRITRALHGIATVICTWADHSETLETPIGRLADDLGIPRGRHGTGWTYLDHSWIDTSEVTRGLSALPGVTAAAVFPEPVDDGVGLTAYVSSKASPAELRAALAAMLAERPNLVLPHRFVVCASAPDDATTGSWAALEPTGTGDGAPDGRLPRTAAEQALAEALSACCPGLVPDMASPYVPLGGQVIRTPRVIAWLAERGFTGIIPADLFGPLPLEAVAEKLRERK